MNITNEEKVLLDKLYNLRGEDSVILKKMNEEKENALETKERTKAEKEELLEKIKVLTDEEQTLAKEGDALGKVLGSIKRSDYEVVLDRLGIDFDPDALVDKLNTMLPGTIEEVTRENEEAKSDLTKVEDEMNNAVTLLEELDIRKDEALNNQAKLNEYFNLSLDGNINITRDALTSLLEKFDFNEEESREAAKILMFPEDALYEYDKSVNNTNKTITDVLIDAKNESGQVESVKETLEEDSKLEQIFDKVIEDNKEAILSESKQDSIIQEKEKAIFSQDESQVNTKSDIDALNELLINNGINGLSDSTLKKILENYDEEVINNNINTLKSYNIDLSILQSNGEVLTDKELSKKLEKLINIGKSSKDISLMPEVLIKYDLNGLNNTINLLEISGLDPKKVPLMAY